MPLPVVSDNLHGKTSHQTVYGIIPCANQMNTKSMPTNAQAYLDSDHMIVFNGVMILTLFVKVIII